MYQAELKGKFSLSMRRSEDILTSNVFSFFKYADRTIFLYEYLQGLGFNSITVEAARDAEFIFWPSFEDGTEPDLVIIAGDYYLLIEAKFYSGFGRGTKTRKPQLIREIETGRLEADNLDKKFILIAITADYYYKPAKFSLIKNEDFIWTNWQRVATMIYEILEARDDLPKHQAEFAGDLYQLLADKKLREYRGKKYLSPGGIDNFADKRIFFQAAAAKYRGGFIGFSQSLSTSENIPEIPERIFFKEEWI